MATYCIADATPRKRGRPKKTAVCLDDRYPALSHTGISAEEVKVVSEALRKEMENAKPRRDVFLPLMKTTFTIRRHFIMHDAASVHDILCDYPALKEASAVSIVVQCILGTVHVFANYNQASYMYYIYVCVCKLRLNRKWS